jgi:adenine-specific DNA-methyltransferase
MEIRYKGQRVSSSSAVADCRKILYGKTFKHGFDIVVACNDVLDFLDTIPRDFVSLIVTSPHYNLGKTHEKPMSLENYLRWQETVIQKCNNVVKDGGSICWQAGNYVKNGEVFPLDAYFYTIFKNLGLKLRNRIIWHYEHGLHCSKRLSGRYETILWFTKGNNYTFNLDNVRVPQKYPGKRAYKGPKKGKPTGNPLGKNPSDVWKVIKDDWDKQVWDIPNVKAHHPEKTIHPSQFPIELPERLVLALTNEGDVVFDPFLGVGSSLIAAVLHNRKGIGVDKEKSYVSLAYCRIQDALEGTLRRRPLGKPIYEPKGNERVATLPPEWKRFDPTTL